MSDKAHIKANTGDAPELNTPTKRIKTAIALLANEGFSGFIEALINKIFISYFRFSSIKRFTLKTLHQEKNDVIKPLVNGVSYVYGMGVKGDIAEFGTMTGQTAVALAVAINQLNSVYRLDSRGIKKGFFFDSFEGLPEARFEVDRQSEHVASGIWAKGTCRGLDEITFKKLISKYLSPDFFTVYKGWFKDTVPLLNNNQQFALVHIDGDLYESAIDVLDLLFQRGQVSRGAMILFDDWNCNSAEPTLGERRAFSEVCKKYDIHYSDAGSYGIASHKFIIHQYSALIKA